jgi:hypothetical protein
VLKLGHVRERPLVLVLERHDNVIGLRGRGLELDDPKLGIAPELLGSGLGLLQALLGLCAQLRQLGRVLAVQLAAGERGFALGLRARALGLLRQLANGA